MWIAKRKQESGRARNLLKRYRTVEQGTVDFEPVDDRRFVDSRLQKMLYYAGLSITPSIFIVTVIFSAVGLTVVVHPYVHQTLVWVVPFIGAWIPISYLEKNITRRSDAFARDYPSVLMAAASSLKIGMTPYQALERSVKLLGKKSLVFIEVNNLVTDLRRGIRKEDAIGKFGDSINLDELSLFRSAFLLVLENGGRFAPTLARLAEVSRDRQALITSAKVSTTTMRMTANILLLLAPVLLLMMSDRYQDYWEILFNHPTAKLASSTGIFIIVSCYFVLRKMSDFKP